MNIQEAIKVLNPPKKVADFFLTDDSVRLRNGPPSERVRDAWNRCYEDYAVLFNKAIDYVLAEGDKVLEDQRLIVFLNKNQIEFLKKKKELLKEIISLITPPKMFDERIFAADAEAAVKKALIAGSYDGLLSFYEIVMPKQSEVNSRNQAVDVLSAAIKKIRDTNIRPLKRFYIPESR